MRVFPNQKDIPVSPFQVRLHAQGEVESEAQIATGNAFEPIGCECCVFWAFDNLPDIEEG